MPIKPENKPRYPADWKAISSETIRKAKNKCEFCGVRNHAVGYRNNEGEFNPLAGNYILDDYGHGLDPNTGDMVSYKLAKEVADFQNMNDEMGERYFVIVLTVAHLDHTPENCHPANLKALCQKCHNNYDAVHRKGTRNEPKVKGQLKLF